MDKWIMCIVALILGMLLANMLKSVCGCKTKALIEGSMGMGGVGGSTVPHDAVPDVVPGVGQECLRNTLHAGYYKNGSTDKNWAKNAKRKFSFCDSMDNSDGPAWLAAYAAAAAAAAS